MSFITDLDQKKLPRYATLNNQAAVERIARSTCAGVYGLLPSEEFWKERQPFLQKHGYLLRKRYSPDWEPSWTGTNLNPIFCEDSIMLLVNEVIDAKRAENGKLVAIKVVYNDTQELAITQFLSSIRESHNHCIPILQILPDPIDSKISLMVLPFLRPCNDPEWRTVGEVIDFIEQSLEGLAFLHSNKIAHRDVAVVNIMMDAEYMFPEGYHPVRISYTPDGMRKATYLTRTERPVRYYYIDFGLSAKFAEGDSHLVVGDVGRDEEVPELSSHVPYDAFKVDIFALGNLYCKELEQRYNSMEFLCPIIKRMKEEKPELRPPIDDILAQWKDTRAALGTSMYRRRLGPRSELAIERVFNDTVAALWESFHNLKNSVA